MAVLHGTFHVDDLKKRSKEVGVSITKYLAAALLWSIIRTETDGKRDEASGSVKSSGESEKFSRVETLANFFAVINIPGRSGGHRLFRVLEAVSRQDGRTDREGAPEKTISYNGRTRKWYVRAIPRL